MSKDFLKNKKAKQLKKNKRDAEGVTFHTGNLFVSFEGKNRIDLYTVEGRKIKKLRIHDELLENRVYQHKNKGLESVAYNEKYGLVTAPELPLTSHELHTIYAKERTWKIPVKGALVSMEFISQDELLLLTNQKSTLTRKVQSLLYIVDLTKVKHIGYSAEFLLQMNGNFEGMTKLFDNLYMIVSDSEDGDIQKTELVLFELL